MLLGASFFDTSLSKLGSKADLTEHERTTIDALYTARLFISKTVKLLGRSRAAIRSYIKGFKKYGKN